jgi:hypothetical protein
MRRFSGDGSVFLNEIRPAEPGRILAVERDSLLGLSDSQYEQDFLNKDRFVPLNSSAYPSRIFSPIFAAKILQKN